jgi:uroporphyrin-3 C-methyltransferase
MERFQQSLQALRELGSVVAVGALSYSQLAAVKRETARRLADLQQAAAAATETATRADAEARAARQQAAVLEARLAEVESQREALEQLYADLSRGRDEAALVEVERLITLGAQELQISGNVPTALAALQTADTRLARLESPRFLPLRRVLAALLLLEAISLVVAWIAGVSLAAPLALPAAAAAPAIAAAAAAAAASSTRFVRTQSRRAGAQTRISRSRTAAGVPAISVSSLKAAKSG